MKRYCYWCGQMESAHTDDNPKVRQFGEHAPWFMDEVGVSNLTKDQREESEAA